MWRLTYDSSGMAPNVRRQIPAIVYATAEIMRREWIRAARGALSKTASTYVAGIGDIEVSNRGRTATIKLTGWLPNALEEGKGPYDLKEGLLHGPNAKRSKDGKGTYATVPFAHTTPNTNPMTAMPAPIYKMAKNLRQGERLKLTGTNLEGYGWRSKISQDASKWGNYTWKTSPFDSMVRQRRFPGMSGTSVAGRMMQYKTFRRVSSKSDPNSWIHPGFRPRAIMERAVAATERRFNEIVENMVLA